MNHLFVPPSYSSPVSSVSYDFGHCQSHYGYGYAADGGSGRTMVAAAAAAEAAATAAAAAVAAANAAQEAAFAASAATTVNTNYGKQAYVPFPARRRKLRADDSWRKMPHQEGWRSYAWDNNRARSRKRVTDRYGAPSRNRRVSKQRQQHHGEPQQHWRATRGHYNGRHVAAEAGGHRTKAKDGQPRSTGYAGAGKASHAMQSPGKNRNAAAKVLELLAQADMSTQTLPNQAYGTQTEPFLDEVMTFSLSKCDSDDDEAEFFPMAEPAQHSPFQEDSE